VSPFGPAITAHLERTARVRISLFGTTAVLAAASVSAIAFGTAGAAEPGASSATTTIAGAPTTTAGAATTVAGAPTTTAAAGGGATTVAGAAGMLPPNATLEQIQAAVIGAFGPTTDLTGELAPFVNAVPAGIPTPEGTVVEEVNVWYYPNVDDPVRSYYSSTMLMTSTVPPPDLVTLFQTAMPAAGFVQTGDSVQNEDGRQVRFLTYDVPQPTSEQDEVTVIVVDESSTTQVDYFQLELDYGLDPAVVDIYAGWPAGLPLIAGVPLDDVSMTTFNFGGDITLNLSNHYTVPIAYADAFSQFEAGLAGTGYTVDPESDPAEGYFDLVGGPLGDLTIFINEGFPEGTTYLSIDSSFEIAA
jgi:hypothetical protein